MMNQQGHPEPDSEPPPTIPSSRWGDTKGSAKGGDANSKKDGQSSQNGQVQTPADPQVLDRASEQDQQKSPPHRRRSPRYNNVCESLPLSSLLVGWLMMNVSGDRYGGRAAPLVTFLLNPNVVQELRGDKQYNLQMLKERYQVTRLNEGITQHKLVPEETVTVIDSRCGEKFSVYKGSGNDSITQQFDACASWWTQGPDPVFQVICAYCFAELAREMAYTAARFGMLCSLRMYMNLP
ncbi:hypothetical protein YC2023_119832 [Brassica napus]